MAQFIANIRDSFFTPDITLKMRLSSPRTDCNNLSEQLSSTVIFSTLKSVK